MTIPNLITIARLFLVPLIIVAIVNAQWELAFAGFVVAGVSDAVDGYLARHCGMASELGAWLDPLADKALIVSIYVTLAIIGAIPVWLVVIVAARDIMIVAAVVLSWLLHRPLAIRPFVVSKVNTAAQIAFAALALGSRAFGLELGSAATLGHAAVALLTLASMAAYLAFWLRHMTR
ncbi:MULTISPECIES: CDP-alcohol phosphatidyltransferase family protein [unclassified Bosea (in: a-proteobacteria)]|uniref:CDP-alcohol phosphatidyltransferase family protein n=1 Tax=unclassified Bosea (in: a-proteobacteria) TaxID=2653178 RepID=UPI0009557A71|nr:MULTISPECIES: CDP-alcohol phosphatidyltransferase family protein [unclassified Bosea (in: a-proteobacteria)]TAJ29268.1 MAG: CDP-alcohol phosphatidyltransferase family protein [Bosea sp. (in: a-proteobacteria)]SIP90948.1 cardiolipin synthase [Bosea sp. TND4EK4]